VVAVHVVGPADRKGSCCGSIRPRRHCSPRL
jgi:hypothetical protein